MSAEQNDPPSPAPERALSPVKAVLALIYGTACYVVFLGTFVYLAPFSDGILVPKSVDSGIPDDAAAAVAIDVCLLFLFGLQHSVMARANFKRVLTRFIPAPLERATFVLASSAVLIVLMAFWQPLPSVLWHVESSWLAAGLWVLNALGWLGVPFSSFMIDHFDLFGVKQPFQQFRRVSVARKGFVTPLLYRYVRHPMMSFFLLALWATPHMTSGHLVLAVGLSLYILVGVHFEERALRAELGPDYLRYQATTPKFFPRGTRIGRRPLEESTEGAI